MFFGRTDLSEEDGLHSERIDVVVKHLITQFVKK